MSYQPPGVRVNVKTRSIAPALIAGDDTIMIMGDNTIYPVSFTDVVRINGSGKVNLSREGINLTVLTVQRRSAPTVSLVLNTDYAIEQLTDSTTGFKTTNISKKYTALTAQPTALTAGGVTDLGRYLP